MVGPAGRSRYHGAPVRRFQARMHALSINDLCKTYRNGFEALKGIDLDVAPGDFFALLGPNGAGKSTAIGIVCSLVRKSGGTVSVYGNDLDADPQAVKRCIGVVPQELNFNQFEPVEEIVINQAGYHGIPRREARRRDGEKPQAARPLGQAPGHGARALRRHEAAADDRAGTGASTSAADPRRAHGRGGHRDPPLHVGLHARDQRRGHHHHPDHPLSGRGREPLPQHRHHRSRAHHRAEHHARPLLAAASRNLRAQSFGAPARRARRWKG